MWDQGSYDSTYQLFTSEVEAGPVEMKQCSDAFQETMEEEMEQNIEATERVEIRQK